MTQKWLRMAEMYKKFCPSNINCTFTKQDAIEVFNHESNGEGNIRHGIFGNPPFNGYLVGKHWMDITIGMWRDDNFKNVVKDDMWVDYPLWFLRKIGFSDGS